MKQLIAALVVLFSGSVAICQQRSIKVEEIVIEPKEQTVKPAIKPPVPVAVGKGLEEEKKPELPKTPSRLPSTNDAPPIAVPAIPSSSDERGLLPLAFVKNRLDNLKPGESCFVSVESMKVDARRRCFLDPATLYGQSQATSRPILVRRDSSGYHVVLDGVEHQWMANEVSMTTTMNWIPVRTVNAR